MKRLRNSGLGYTSVRVRKKADGSKELVQVTREPKKILAACNAEKCRLKCSLKLSEEQRKTIFNEYWGMADLQKQRMFVASSITQIKPRYRYLNAERQYRGFNNAFHFKIKDTNIRVCKIFFMATLGINSRIIRTVLQKQEGSLTGVLQGESRGKHNNHSSTSEEIKADAKHHIQSIPRIDSHYCRQGTKKEYIEGGRSVADLHRLCSGM